MVAEKPKSRRLIKTFFIMKKNLVFILIFSASLLSFGQETVTESFKPDQGYTLEVNFTPFDGPNMISINSLNFRRFLSSETAIRLGVSLNRQAWKTDNEKAGDDMYISKQSTFLFGLKPGIEKHFAGTNRLSPYFGAELDFRWFTSKAEETSGSDIYEISGATDEDFSNRKYIYFGLGIVAGTDYYFSKDIYMGAEIGFGYGVKSYGSVDVTEGNTTTTTGDKTTESMFGQNFKPALRLGWKF